MVSTQGWKTSEFWLALLATLVGTLLASGALPSAGVAYTALGFISTVLASLGYSASRGKVKAAEATANAAVEVSKNLPLAPAGPPSLQVVPVQVQPSSHPLPSLRPNL